MILSVSIPLEIPPKVIPDKLPLLLTLWIIGELSQKAQELLQGSVKTVPEVTQPGQDVLLLVQLSVHACGKDFDIGMGCL